MPDEKTAGVLYRETFFLFGLAKYVLRCSLICIAEIASGAVIYMFR